MAIAIVIGIVRVRSPAPPPPPEPAIDVEIAGCAAVIAGPICELPIDGALRIWVRARADAVAFASPTMPLLGSEIRETQDGTAFRVVVPEGTTELRVQRRSGATVRTIRLGPRSAPAWLAEARALRQKGDGEGAASLARSAQASENVIDRAFASGLLARMELAAGRPRASFPLFREAVALHRSAGRVSDAADDSFALAFALNQRSHRYSDARLVLNGARSDVEHYPEGRAREAYYRGTLAMETGDARSALRLLREARDRAARVGLTLLERNANNAIALQLLLLGRTREALDLLARLETDATAAADATPCEKVEIAINTGYGALLVNEEGGASATEAARADATGPLARALALTEGACQDRYLRAAALGNLALDALQRKDLRAARDYLEQARTKSHEARAVEVFFWHDIEGRIALADDDPRRALAAFEEEARLAHAALSFEAEWRALTGKGEALERLGRREEAIAALLAAEALLTESSFLVPLGEGRGTFLGDRGRSARAAVELLVRAGRVDQALEVARRSRGRVVAALTRAARVEAFGDVERARWEEAFGTYRSARAALDAEAKDDWKLPRTEAALARSARDKREGELRASLDAAFAIVAGGNRERRRLALPPLPSDSLTLVFHPVRDGWVGIAGGAFGVTAFELADITPASGDHLLGPLRSRLGSAHRLRVLAYGSLRSVDFHALSYEGQPLLAKIPVEYPLDMPEPTTAGDGEATALVVADPTLDLVHARSEAELVVGVLRDRGWSLEMLTGPSATSGKVLPLLARARLMHYAGHGVFAGREGWESALPLAAGGRLTIGDILASPGAPSRVVLSGCETARGASDAPVESLGIAQAFIVAGADFVIAPVRPIDDVLAARMSTALYEGLAAPDAVDAAEVLRRAQLRVRAENPDLDWSAFRVLRR